MDKLNWAGEVWPGSRPKPRPEHSWFEIIGLAIPMLIIVLGTISLFRLSVKKISGEEMFGSGTYFFMTLFLILMFIGSCSGAMK